MLKRAAAISAALLFVAAVAWGQGASNLGGINIKKGPCGEALKINKTKCQFPTGGGAGSVGPPPPGAGRGGTPLLNALSWDTPGLAQQRLSGLLDSTLFTDPMGSFSTCFWMEVDTGITAFQGPMGSTISAAFNNGWGFYRSANDDQIAFFVGTFVTAFTATVTDVFTPVDGWKHVCGVHDGPNRQLTIYVNAAQSQSGVDQTAIARPVGTNHTIGKPTATTTAGFDFRGKIDEPVFWAGVILSQANVTALYNSGTPLDPTTIVASPTWWLRNGDDPGDDDTVTTGTVIDQSGNGNDFTPEGGPTAGAFVADVPP